MTGGSFFRDMRAQLTNMENTEKRDRKRTRWDCGKRKHSKWKKSEKYQFPSYTYNFGLFIYNTEWMIGFKLYE